MSDSRRLRPAFMICGVFSALLGAAGPVLAIVWWVNINTYLDSQHDHFALLGYALACAFGAFILAIISLREPRSRVPALIGLVGAVTGVLAVVVAVALLVIGILRWAAQ